MHIYRVAASGRFYELSEYWTGIENSRATLFCFSSSTFG